MHHQQAIRALGGSLEGTSLGGGLEGAPRDEYGRRGRHLLSALKVLAEEQDVSFTEVTVGEGLQVLCFTGTCYCVWPKRNGREGGYERGACCARLRTVFSQACSLRAWQPQGLL